MNSKDIIDGSKEKYMYLTTVGRTTGNSHTVELWFAVFKERIYLSHEGDYTDWMRNILKNEGVKFKIGNLQFQGKARICTDGITFERGKQALYLKYYGKAKKEAVDDWFSESTIIEITV